MHSTTPIRAALLALGLPALLATAAPAEKAALRYTFQKGHTQRIVATSDMFYEISVGGNQSKVPQKLTYHATVTVAEIDGVGNAYLDIALERIAMEHGSLVLPIKFDSDSPPENLSPIGKTLQYLVGNTVQATITSRGELFSILGFQEGVDAGFDPYPMRNEQQKRAAIDMVGKMLNNDVFRDMMGLHMVLLPEEPVQTGDTWTHTVTTTRGLPHVLDYTCTLKELTDTTITIAGTAKARTNDSAEPIGFGDATMTYKFDGTQEFEAVIPRASGMPARHTTTIDLGGEMTMSVVYDPQKDPQLFHFPVKLEGTQAVAPPAEAAPTPAPE